MECSKDVTQHEELQYVFNANDSFIITTAILGEQQVVNYIIMLILQVMSSTN